QKSVRLIGFNRTLFLFCPSLLLIMGSSKRKISRAFILNFQNNNNRINEKTYQDYYYKKIPMEGLTIDIPKQKCEHCTY
ncbi:hypothetical protein, partial [Lysinibacillus mangiferihumi]